MALLAVAGGSAVIAGALLPWITFYAGLQTVSGTSGANGKAMLVAGVVMCALAALQWRKPVRSLRVTSGLLGLAVLSSAALLLVRANDMLQMQTMMMMVPGIGAGLWVALGGGAAVMGAALGTAGGAKS